MLRSRNLLEDIAAWDGPKLEVGAVVDYGPAGTWLRVPLGKLATERTVPRTSRPCKASTNGRIGEVAIARSHPRTGRSTDFLFTEYAAATRFRNGSSPPWRSRSSRSGRSAVDSDAAPAPAHLRDPVGERRHVSGGADGAARSRHAGTIRYATLASPTLLSAYDEAMGKMLKTRAAHGLLIPR